MATEAQVQTMLELMQQQMEQLKQLQTENTQLRNNNNTDPPAERTKRPDRPVVNANIDEREWELFKDSWQRYKTMAGLTRVENIRMELRASCSTDVNRLLFEFVGAPTLDTTTEAEMLTHIRAVAVKGTHKEVHRMNFFKLNQMEGESITQFVARLKSQASLCQFNITCNAHNPPTTMSYADDMVTQQLIAGLRNQQHQSRVLAEATTLNTLAAKIARLQCLESTEESTTKMRNLPPNSVSKVEFTRQSNYRRVNKPPPGSKNGKQANNNCRGCGRPSHGDGKSMARKDCPAFNKECNHCGIPGHFRSVCEKIKTEKQSRAAAVNEDMEEHYELQDENPSFAFSTRQNLDFRLAPNTNGRP